MILTMGAGQANPPLKYFNGEEYGLVQELLIPACIIKAPVPPRAKLVFAALFTHICLGAPPISQNVLAEMAGTSGSNFRNELGKLAKLGLVEVMPGSSRTCNTYKLAGEARAALDNYKTRVEKLYRPRPAFWSWLERRMGKPLGI